MKAELIEASSLYAIVHSGDRHRTPRTLLYLIRDGVMGLAHLHAIGVMHGAVSTAAVLLRFCNGTLQGAIDDTRLKRASRLRRPRRGKPPLWTQATPSHAHAERS